MTTFNWNNPQNMNNALLQLANGNVEMIDACDAESESPAVETLLVQLLKAQTVQLRVQASILRQMTRNHDGVVVPQIVIPGNGAR